jgi:hypothetical protein
MSRGSKRLAVKKNKQRQMCPLLALRRAKQAVVGSYA